MTLFSRQSRCSTFVLLSLTAIIASTVLISSSDNADARHRRGHRAKVVRPPAAPAVPLPVVPPLPQDNPRAAAPEAPKPAEKPADEIQKADPKRRPFLSRSQPRRPNRPRTPRSRQSRPNNLARTRCPSRMQATSPIMRKVSRRPILRSRPIGSIRMPALPS